MKFIKLTQITNEGKFPVIIPVSIIRKIEYCTAPTLGTSVIKVMAVNKIEMFYLDERIETIWAML